jgi:hypothetical protein
VTTPAGFDIRLPIGVLFAVLGALLVAYGLATHADAELYARSLAINVNLWWGLAMLAFGAAMLTFGARATRRHAHESGVHLAADSPEGRATEAREHRRGLESSEP